MKGFSLVLALLLSSAFLSAQGDQSTVFRGGTELVSLSVVVTNPQHQFVIGLDYTPKNARSDGKYRRVVVRVSQPGTSTRTRAGYVAPRAQQTTRVR